MFSYKAKIFISNKQKSVKLQSTLRMMVRRCCLEVLDFENFVGNCELSITFVDNKKIKLINSEFRDKNIETDVLSFPMGIDGAYDLNPDTGNYVLGDIVISLEKVVFQAEMYGHTFQRELAFLTVHGMLHILGYDHERSSLECSIMQEKEEAILNKLGISRIKNDMVLL